MSSQTGTMSLVIIPDWKGFVAAQLLRAVCRVAIAAQGKRLAPREGQKQKTRKTVKFPLLSGVNPEYLRKTVGI
jgi:hypothetical protein